MTQGLISILSGDQVIMKIIAGCNGYNAKKVAEIIKKEWPVEPEKAHEIAISNHFGAKYDLVVITEDKEVFNGGEELHPHYQETFNDPSFNPRWENGTCDNLEIIEI